MRWSDLPIRPTSKTLRQFAGLWLLGFGGLALWRGLAKGQPSTGFVLAGIALVVGMTGLVRPSLVRWPFVAWMILAFPIGWTISQILLSLLFFGVFTPLALLFRLRGRDALGLRRRPGVDSYWTARPAETDPRRYFRQF